MHPTCEDILQEWSNGCFHTHQHQIEAYFIFLDTLMSVERGPLPLKLATDFLDAGYKAYLTDVPEDASETSTAHLNYQWALNSIGERNGTQGEVPEETADCKGSAGAAERFEDTPGRKGNAEKAEIYEDIPVPRNYAAAAEIAEDDIISGPKDSAGAAEIFENTLGPKFIASAADTFRPRSPSTERAPPREATLSAVTAGDGMTPTAGPSHAKRLRDEMEQDGNAEEVASPPIELPKTKKRRFKSTFRQEKESARLSKLVRAEALEKGLEAFLADFC